MPSAGFVAGFPRLRDVDRVGTVVERCLGVRDLVEGPGREVIVLDASAARRAESTVNRHHHVNDM